MIVTISPVALFNPFYKYCNYTLTWLKSQNLSLENPFVTHYRHHHKSHANNAYCNLTEILPLLVEHPSAPSSLFNNNHSVGLSLSKHSHLFLFFFLIQLSPFSHPIVTLKLFTLTFYFEFRLFRFLYHRALRDSPVLLRIHSIMPFSSSIFYPAFSCNQNNIQSLLYRKRINNAQIFIFLILDRPMFTKLTTKVFEFQHEFKRFIFTSFLLQPSQNSY